MATTTTKYYRCQSTALVVDELAVRLPGAPTDEGLVFFQTTAGHTVYLNQEQVTDLIAFITQGSIRRKRVEPMWREEVLS